MIQHCKLNLSTKWQCSGSFVEVIRKNKILYQSVSTKQKWSRPKSSLLCHFYYGCSDK